MSSRPKNPKYARNKNILVIGGSGSGKTRFFVKPSLMQMHSSYVVTDPKGQFLSEVGTMLRRGAPKLDENGKPMRDARGKVIYEPYRIKVLNTINFKKSMKYNPFAYIRSEKDILKLVNVIIANTKGDGEKSSEDFWVKAERLLYCALIGYIWYEAEPEEKNFLTLLEFINASEAREDDEEFQSPVDLLFAKLEKEHPNHFAVRQYRKFKLAAGKTLKSILISYGARLAPFDMKVQDITTRVVDKYIQTLQKTPAVNTRTHHAKTEFVTNATIEKIIKLLRCAFKQAVRWELVAKNPFDNVILPKTEYAKRDIWTADMIRLALDKCTDSKLYVAMNLSFACSLRMGEILGLTWENVHISDEDIAADNAYVYIDKELARASKRAIETLGEKDIYYIFTPLMPNTSTRIILKKPKTDSSIRKAWLPKTLAYILREWKKSQDELKGFLGDEYQDFDLVVALPNGRPCEDRIILKEFAKLREDAGLPKVVFHSLRHFPVPPTN